MLGVVNKAIEAFDVAFYCDYLRDRRTPKIMMEHPVKFQRALVCWSTWAVPLGRRQVCYIVWMRLFMPQNMGGGDRRISRPDGAFKYV